MSFIYMYKYVDQKGLVAILAMKLSAGVAPEVNRGIHCVHVRKHTSKESTLALKPRVDVTRSPARAIYVPKKRDWCSPKIFLKNSQNWSNLSPELDQVWHVNVHGIYFTSWTDQIFSHNSNVRTCLRFTVSVLYFPCCVCWQWLRVTPPSFYTILPEYTEFKKRDGCHQN